MSKNTLLSELINYISANSSGNVVIAAPSSGYALDVTGTGRFTSSITGVNATFAGTPSNTVQAAGSPFLYLNGGTGTSYTTLQQGVGKFDIYQFNGSAFVNTFTFTSTGNLGIGTSAPENYLSPQLVVSAPSFGGITISSTNTTNTNYLCFARGTTTNLPYIGSISYNHGSDFMAFATSGTERMRITSGGSVQIGGTVTTSKLGVTDGAKSSNAVPFTLSSNDGSTSMQLYFQRNINLYYEIQSVEQGVSYRSLYLNLNGGGVYAGTQRIDNNSDIRVKENIQPVTNALSTIMSLSGKKFNMIDEDNILRYGFIAQEVQPVLNDFVTESTRSYMDGDNVIENILTLESSGTAWAALLVEAIKELKSEIDLLKQQ